MMRPRVLVLAAVFLGGVTWAVGCGEDATEPTQPPEPLRPTTVTVTPPTAELTAVGTTVQLSAEVRDQHSQVMAGITVTWGSSSSGVATVGAGGLVTAAGNGAATITATAGMVSGSAAVTVAQEVRGIEVLPADQAVAAGDTVRMTAEARDANGYAVPGVEFAWSSSDPAIATVDGSGLVTAVAEGRATITAASVSMSTEGSVQIRVAHPDWLALTALYEAADGPGWIERGGWMSDLPIGQWHGVTTGESGHVTALRLPASDLAGPIPAELGRLLHLEVLDLERNSLAGPIPPELGRLEHLKALNLGVNDLTGQIPPELGGLTSLEDLRLRRNELTGPIPPELGNLRSLRRLGVNRNLLTGPIPQDFLDLEQLRLFHFSENESVCVGGSADFASWLAQLDVYVGPLCNEGDRETLASLYGAMGGTDWDHADGWLGDGPLHEWHGVGTDSIGRVTTLDLSDNGLEGVVPATLALLTGMTSLRIEGNAGLTGQLPLSLAALSLQELRYQGTELCVPPDPVFGEWLAAIPSHEGTDAECSPLSEREILQLLYDATGGADWRSDDNWLSDQPLGKWHGVVTNDAGRVVALRLVNNNLSGPLPPQLGELGQLGELNLARNFLTGPIPPQLGDLSNLSQLHLNGNGLTGPIPAELSGLSNLLVLHLYLNRLTGPIPSELGNLSRLVALGLGYNGLTGPIPQELGNLSNLSALYLDWIGLTGPIPSELSNLSRLSELILSGNRLTGSIPAWLGNLSSLTRLRLDGNELTGSIPAELGNLLILSGLYLNRNGLTGPIPAELGNLSSLVRLSLDGNELTGSIPAELGNLPRMSTLFLHENELAGPIPSGLGNLSSLLYLHLDGNELTGPIPPAFGGLSRLRSLSIKENRLSGSLPPELNGMMDLEGLYLIDNTEMSGALPSSLTSLGKLKAVALTGTGLCASADSTFQAWLSDLNVARVRLCGASTGSSAYLTQTVQSLDFPVPLVAGKEALLRVFVTAARSTTEGIPNLRATFYVDGVETHAVEIPGSGTPIPTLVADAESALDKSANARIPGSVVQPGLEMVIEIDPEGTLDPGLGVAKRIPETGRAPVSVEAVPTLDLTVVPFQWARNPDSWIVDIANGMVADPQSHEMLEDSRILLPVGDLDVKAHEAVLTSTTNMSDLIGETYLIRTLEGGSGYYMGIMPERVVGGQSGVGFLGFPVGFSVADPFVIAHEFGHNMSLFHAPCGGAGGPDRAFPQSDGSIGAWGYDFRGSGSLVSPNARDMMSYCGPPRWVSDFSFTKALNHRVSNGDGAAALVRTAVQGSTRTLILWGGVDEQGDLFMEPALVTDAPPSVPRSPGVHALTGRTATGDELFSLNFDMMEMADADGRSSFVFALPVQAEWAGILESLTLSGPEGSVTTDRTTDQPMAILRDPENGQVQAILRGEDAADLTGVAAEAVGSPSTPLKVLFSRGIPDGGAWRP